MTLDPERRHALRGMKLRALVVDEIGDPGDELVVDGDHRFDGSRPRVLAAADAPDRAPGAAGPPGRRPTPTHPNNLPRSTPPRGATALEYSSRSVSGQWRG